MIISVGPQILPSYQAEHKTDELQKMSNFCIFSIICIY